MSFVGGPSRRRGARSTFSLEHKLTKRWGKGGGVVGDLLSRGGRGRRPAPTEMKSLRGAKGDNEAGSETRAQRAAGRAGSETRARLRRNPFAERRATMGRGWRPAPNEPRGGRGRRPAPD